MKFEILPHLGVGSVAFGMTSHDIRATLGVAYESFFKSPSQAHPVDAFDSIGIHVYYTADGRCEAVELFSPAVPTVYNDRLVGVPFSCALEVVGRYDANLEIDESGFVSMGLGFSVYCPGHNSNSGATIEGVFVFSRDYYG